MRERLSLESSLDSMQDELQSAHKKLDYEARWRDSAQSTHKKLLQEKAELQSRLASRFLHICLEQKANSLCLNPSVGWSLCM